LDFRVGCAQTAAQIELVLGMEVTCSRDILY